MDEWASKRSYGEKSCGKQQHAPRAQQPSKVDGERADKHERCIEGTVEPGAIVEAYANVPLQIGKAETEHTAGKGDESGASDDSQNTQQGTRRYFRRHSRGGRTRDLYRRRANCDGRSC